MKKTFLLLPVVLACFALGACDKATTESNAAKEKTADAIENKADATKDAAAAKAHEDKAQGEAAAKDIKKEADAVRDTKQ